MKFAYQGNNPSSNYFLVDNISILDENATTYDHFTGEVLSANDYYAFGANMPGRNFSSNSYRYGFNGKENDPESGTQDYGMRIYNPNLGKFLSVDPLRDDYAWNSTYAFAENRPIDGIDLDGAEFLSGALDLLDKYIPLLEQTNSNKNLVDAAKFVRGMGNSTLEGSARAIVKNASQAKEALDANPGLLTQFVKNTLTETLKTSEQKFGEAMYRLIKGTFVDKDPEISGELIGALVQLYAFETGFATKVPKINPFEGLTPKEAGILGERLMEQMLQKKYAGQEVTIVKQMYAKSGSNGTFIDATVVMDATGKILEVAESKYNSSKIKTGSGQDMMYNDKAEFTTSGKVATETGNANRKIDSGTTRTVYRWDTNGELNIESK